MVTRRKLLWGSVGVATLLTLVSVADSGGFRRYVQLRKDSATLAERNRNMAAANRVLIGQIAALRSDPRAMERAAREELGFIKPGEVIINLESP